MVNDVPLAYRALTGEDPAVLWERVKEALSQDYTTVGGMQSLVDQVAKTTLFMRLVIDPARVAIKDVYVTQGSQLFYGDTSRDFCEKISNLVTDGWKLVGEPVLYFQSGKPAIRQMLCR